MTDVRNVRSGGDASSTVGAMPRATSARSVLVAGVLGLSVLALAPVVLTAAVAAALLAAVRLADWSGAAAAQLAFWVTVPLVAALVVATRTVLAARPEPADGPELGPDDAPGLWDDLAVLAGDLGTAPPHRVVVVPEAGASVNEVGGRRELALGLPLLVGLDRGQLRAVLAHELAHYGGGHTALSARTWRAAALLGEVHGELPAGPVRWLVGGLLRLHRLASAAATRALEADADRAMARAAGGAVAASALQRVVEVDLAWGAYTDYHLPLADAAQRRPRLAEGLVTLLAADAHDLRAATTETVESEASSWLDTHPPVRDRVAALLATSPTCAPATDANAAGATATDGKALDVLAGPAVLRRLETELLTSVELADLPEADWDELVALAGARMAADDAGALARAARDTLGIGSLSPAVLLDAVADGRGPALVAPLVHPGVPAAERAEADREVLLGTMEGFVADALVRSGRARHVLDWTGPMRLVLDRAVVRDLSALEVGMPGVGTDGTVDLEALLAPLTTGPGGVAVLRERLALLGVLDAEGAEAVAEPEPQAQALLTKARVTGSGRAERVDLVVCDTGLLVVPAEHRRHHLTAGLRDATGVTARQERARVQSLLERSVAEMRAVPGAVWVDGGDVRAARLNAGLRGLRLQLALPTGRLEVRSTADGDLLGPVGEALGHLLGARLDAPLDQSVDGAADAPGDATSDAPADAPIGARTDGARQVPVP